MYIGKYVYAFFQEYEISTQNTAIISKISCVRIQIL